MAHDEKQQVFNLPETRQNIFDLGMLKQFKMPLYKAVLPAYSGLKVKNFQVRGNQP